MVSSLPAFSVKNARPPLTFDSCFMSAPPGRLQRQPETRIGGVEPVGGVVRDPDDVEEQAAAIGRVNANHTSDVGGVCAERHGHAHRGLASADGTVRKEQDDDRERPRPGHGSTSRARA